ncbi:hypothetical protein Y032_0196g1545 [Ancylostoma ceylanicum]|uniref:Disintegrin n=1 Tax=Ancylostoma ceylanicum TaxID=53326 RepID=A0A016SNK1_9BILA|nr:hypothetical protein Y032_0196g1545 [Ancylostoma ceylanicum]
MYGFSQFRAGTLQVLMDHQGSLEYKTTLGFNKPQQLHRNPIYEGHPENPNRIDVCRNLLTECGLIKECQEVDTFPSLDDLDLRQTHTEGHVNRLLKEAISMDQDSLNHLCEDYDSVFMTPGSVEAAKSAVSCCRWLAESIVENKIPNAFALVRPPGHHADRYSACGFCLFNNAAQAAEAAFNFGADRILIVDLDIHHGQGTQQIFYEDKRVMVLSVHRYEDGKFWPHLRESNFDHVGDSEGAGYNINITLNETGCGDADYIAIFWNVLWPLAREFCPDFVIISAGFDSCDGDPLGEMRLSPDAYSHIVYHLRGLAHGKLLLILEGGYNHSVQSVGVHRCLRVLCGYKPLPISLVEPPKASTVISCLNSISVLRGFWNCFDFYVSGHCKGKPWSLHHPTISFEPPKEEEKENTSNVLQENLFKNEWHCKASTAPSKMLLVHNGDSSKHYNCVEEDHPEKPARTASIMAKLESCGLPSKCEVLLNERVATDSELEAVHERPYIQKMKRTAELANFDDLCAKTFLELTTRSKREAKTNKSTLPAYYSEYNDGKWRYVELALVADYSVFAKYDKDEAKVMERLQTIAHHVNALYYPLNIRITLVWVDIWKDGDKFEVATSGDRTLDHFLNYRKGIIKAHPNDNAHMLTDIRFDASVVGKAFKGTMCSYDYSGGVDVDHSDNAAVVAATVAHEMGHNFGMEHDVDYGTTCNCPGNHCVMAPSTGASPPSFWSDCSLRYLYNSFNRGVDLCLKNPPEKTIGGAKCGNGIVEPGEECDCGREQCSHSCCDGKTCRLAGDAECADGDCCDFLTCKPKPRATMCRAPVGICDLPEYCNGDTPDCPADFFIQNGDVCPGRKNEYCYEGQCGSRPDQCVSIWGPTGKEGDRACFQQNTNGIIQGNCGFDVHTRMFTRCLADDIMCGRLQCGTQAERPIFGDPTTVTSAYTYVRVGTETHQCHVIKTTYVVGQKNKPDPGMVLDGSECGDNKICVNAKCKPLSEVSKTVSKCNDHCHYRGVCNNVGNCHCENGFGGIACEIPGFGGSVNSNPSSTSRGITPSTVLLVLLAISSLALILICSYYWFMKKRNLAGEFWEYMRKTLKLHGVLVPVRKAPPPPRRHMKRESLNAMWGDGSVTYSVNERPPTLVPPAIPLMSVNAGTASPKPRSPDHLLARVPSACNGTNNKPKTVAIFTFSVLTNPSRRVLASLWAKIAKNQ